MSPAEISPALALYRRLDAEIRRRPRGTIVRIAKAVGRSAGWWHSRAETGALTLSQLIGILDELGLDPVKFLRDALGREDRLELDRPLGEPPELVKRALERCAEGREGRGVGQKWIETLDELRLNDPAEVLRMSSWAVDHVERELLPRLLGAAGSSLIVMVRLQEAQHVLLAGIELAQQQQDRKAVGNLLRRLASAVGYEGDPSTALRLVERSTLIHLGTRDSEEIGRSLVAQGTWLYYLGRSEEAVELLEQSLTYLPPSAARYRFSAYQGLGYNYRALGNLSAAMESLGQAEKALPDDDVWARGKLLWLKSSLHADHGETVVAKLVLREVMDLFRRTHYGEAAIATCELVRLELQGGDWEAAFQAAKSLRPLVEPLRHNKVVSAVLADLLRFGRESLTLAVVQKAIRRLEDERLKVQSWFQLSVEGQGPYPRGSAIGPNSAEGPPSGSSGEPF